MTAVAALDGRWTIDHSMARPLRAEERGSGSVAQWLVKSEPDSWSFEDQVAAGAKGTFWNGVRNHTAKQNLMAMKRGEKAFFYHSNVGKAVVGIVEIIRDYYPDPSDASGRFGMVDVMAVTALPRPVPLDAVKAEPALAEMMLVKNSRLSVQPVSDAEWTRVCAMGGLEGDLAKPS